MMHIFVTPISNPNLNSACDVEISLVIRFSANYLLVFELIVTGEPIGTILVFRYTNNVPQ